MNIVEKEGLSWYEGAMMPTSVCHGFPTREGGYSKGQFTSLNLATSRGDDPQAVASNYQKILDVRGIAPVGFARNAQVHGTTVHVVTREGSLSFAEFVSPEGQVLQGDGLVTQEKGVLLFAYGADCVPLLLCDPVQKVVGAAHAGWRGTAQGIGKVMVDTMVENFGTCPQDVQVVLGPSIGACCFMCSRDVPEEMEKQLGEEVRPFIPPHATEQNKFSVDLWGINTLWLKKAGVISIESSPPCTACHREEFWSHRKMGEQRGALGGYIYLPVEGELT